MESISLDLDLEWREMTEEEQSLAMEEQSLNLEIEKAESELESVDAELARQVDEEAEEYPILEAVSCLKNLYFFDEQSIKGKIQQKSNYELP